MKRSTLLCSVGAKVLTPLLLVSGMAGVVAASTPARAASDKGPAGSFASPAAAERPMYRFWDTGGLMTPQSAAEQVAQIKASGGGGFEANQLTQLLERAPGYDPATMSWGTPAWTRALIALLTEGKAQGLRVDAIYTPG